jgi:hypothetical protein
MVFLLFGAKVVSQTNSSQETRCQIRLKHYKNDIAFLCVFTFGRNLKQTTHERRDILMNLHKSRAG